ncbi:hypothetical protein M501DRAFT_995244 [Patellaria atrata CBS 101060]|uniref:Uncharacterized protein n=1 Tax=Patellaria atrata CBS 101060 TaxID=1346257 RepID=A0A9P4VQ54_9PEZI|nr:hypothetical protein M501DRAFT_995244 [Patellaria atrata CBS 101060]
MSGTGENTRAWRRGSNAPSNAQRQNTGPSRDRSGANTPNRQDSGRTSLGGSQAGNAWGRDKNAGGASVGSGGAVGGAFADESHVEVGGFNGAAVRENLRKGYKDAIAASGADEKSLLFKSQADAPAKSGGVWGTKPSQMANGQDFFIQLRKQLANLEK